MRQTNLNFAARQWGNLPKFAAVAVLLLGCLPGITGAQQLAHKTFATP
jgi:hypothetical protein